MHHEEVKTISSGLQVNTREKTNLDITQQIFSEFLLCTWPWAGWCWGQSCD